MKKIWLIVLFTIAIFLAGCTSQSDNSTLPKTNVNLKLHNVNFHVVDQNNTPIEHALVTATYNSSEFSEPAPNRMVIYSDENGNWTFVMRGDIQYNITMSTLRDGTIFRNVSFFPTDTEYRIRIIPPPSPTQTQIPSHPPTSWNAYTIQDLNDGANTIANVITKTANNLTKFIT